MNIWNSIIDYLQNYPFHVIVTLVIGGIAGCVIRNMIKGNITLDTFRKTKKHFENLENWIMLISFVIAVACMVRAASGNATAIDSQYLSLYSSFIFAWILTKKTASRDFKKNQHKIAKSTYRHIADAETAVLIAKNRLMEKRGSTLGEGDIQGLLDDMQIILTCIRSNKNDWKDMLTKSYRDKLDKEDNPEDILARDYYSSSNSTVEPEEVRNTFSDNIREAKIKG